MLTFVLIAATLIAIYWFCAHRATLIVIYWFWVRPILKDSACPLRPVRPRGEYRRRVS